MLELQHLFKSFRTIPAVQDVSFTIEAGEIVGFLGRNGAGKSTTVKMITGMLRPNEGRVLFAGRDIRDDLPAFRASIGYVPEEAQLYTYLSGLEYLQLIGRLRGLAEAVIEVKATRLLKLLQLESWQYSPITSYSKGMRQRVLIAAALLHDPRLLIFDEPLSGLDVVSGRLFKDLLEMLAAQGKAILIVSPGARQASWGFRSIHSDPPESRSALERLLAAKTTGHRFAPEITSYPQCIPQIAAPLLCPVARLTLGWRKR